MENDLRSRLIDDAAVSALVANRVYSEEFPQNPQFPAVVFVVVDCPRVQPLDGPGILPHPRVQVSCWADTPKAAKQVATAVRQCLDGFSGLMGATNVLSITVLDEAPAPFEYREGAPAGYRRDLDVEIWYVE